MSRPLSLAVRSILLLALATLAPTAATAQTADNIDTSAFDAARGGGKENVKVDRPQEEIYGGVIPGTRDEVRHVQTKTRRLEQINWIGFVPDVARTRVFIQTSPGATYETSRGEDGSTVILTFKNTRVENTNLLRWIDTSHYDRAVTRIDAKRRGKTVTVTITAAPGASPSFDQRGEYIYVDFPHDPGIE